MLDRNHKVESRMRTKIYGDNQFNKAKLTTFTFPGFRASRDIKDFSYPACCAAATSASFSILISFSFASRASATFSKICFLS